MSIEVMSLGDGSSPARSLIYKALNNTSKLLEGYGNILSPKHRSSLEAISKEMAEIALLGKESRTAFDLSTGLGKTTSIRGFIKAIQDLGLDNSVAISAEKVDALIELRKELLNDGVKEDSIGILHSYERKEREKDGKSFVESTSKKDIENKQFLLITHNRIKHDKVPVEQYYLYKGRPRDLVIWDESLLIADGKSISKSNLVGALASYISDFEDKQAQGRNLAGVQEATYRYLRECETLIRTISYVDNTEFRFPEYPDGYDLGDLEYGLSSFSTTVWKDSIKTIGKLLHFTTLDCRAVVAGGCCFITYEVVVPEELKKIVILDASYPVRKLVHLDKSIRYDEQGSMTKDYSNVTLHHWRGKAGRVSLENVFEKSTDNKISSEVGEICKTIHKDNPEDSILVFTYKDRYKRYSIQDSIIGSLKDGGVDISKVHFLTWGMETNLNSYAHCKHVILAGIISMNKSDLAARMVGQARNDLKITESLVQELIISEQGHSIYQALSRGYCRHTENGKAGEMSVYMFHTNVNPIKELLVKVMPNARWVRYTPKYMSKELNKQEELAEQIQEVLEGLEIDKISTQALRKEYFNGVNSKLWTRALKFLQDLTTDWGLVGRSFIKGKIPFEQSDL